MMFFVNPVAQQFDQRGVVDRQRFSRGRFDIDHQISRIGINRCRSGADVLRCPSDWGARPLFPAGESAGDSATSGVVRAP